MSYIGPTIVGFKQDGIYKYIEINLHLSMCIYFDASRGVNNAFQLTCRQSSNFHLKKLTCENVIYDDLFSESIEDKSFIVMLLVRH